MKQEKDSEKSSQLTEITNSAEIAKSSTSTGLLGKLKMGFWRLINNVTSDIAEEELTTPEGRHLSDLKAKCYEETMSLHERATEACRRMDDLFERIHKEQRMQEAYEAYLDLGDFVKYNFPDKTHLWEAYYKYLGVLGKEAQMDGVFKHKYQIRRAMDCFSNDYMTIDKTEKLLMLIFNDEVDKAAALLEWKDLPKKQQELGRNMFLDLVRQDPKTIALFIVLLKKLPKHFINSEERAELLMTFAERNSSDNPLPSADSARHYIEEKESKQLPYR